MVLVGTIAMLNNFSLFILLFITSFLFNCVIAAETATQDDIVLTEQQLEQVEQLEEQIEQILNTTNDDELSEEDSKKLEALEQQINTILGIASFEESEPTLSVEQTEKLNELETLIEKIMSSAENDDLSDEDIERLEALEHDIEKLLNSEGEDELIEGDLQSFETDAESLLDIETETLSESEQTNPLRPMNISGGVSFGVLHQSNATFSTDSSVIKLLGSDFPRDVNTSPQEDFNAYANVFLNLKKELNSSGTTVFDTNLSGVANQYAEVNRLDYTALNGRFGVVFFSADKMNSIKPYAILGMSESGAGSRSFQFGGGLSSRLQLSDKLTLSGDASFKNNDIKNNRSSNIKIDISNVNLSIYYQINSNHSINVASSYTLSESEDITSDYSGYYVSAGYTVNYPAPFTILSDENWRLNLRTMYLNNDYDRADANIDPNTAREDESWTFTIANTISLPNSWRLNLDYTYNVTNSNLPNFEYDNTGLKIGVSRYF